MRHTGRGDPRQRTCSWGFVSSHGCCSVQKDGSRDLWSAELGWIREVGAVRTELFSQIRANNCFHRRAIFQLKSVGLGSTFFAFIVDSMRRSVY